MLIPKFLRSFFGLERSEKVPVVILGTIEVSEDVIKLLESHGFAPIFFNLDTKDSLLELRYLLEKTPLLLYKPKKELLQLAALVLATFSNTKIAKVNELAKIKSIIRELKANYSLEFNSRYFKHDGIRMHYLELGDPTKPKVLFLHGIGSLAVTYAPLFKNLKDDFHIIAPDLPFFGKSDIPKGNWNHLDFAKYLQEFIKYKKLNNFILSGHSFGGALAITIASNFDVNIKKIVLFAPAGAKHKDSGTKLIGRYMLRFMPNGTKAETQVVTDILLSIAKLWNGKNRMQYIRHLIQLALSEAPIKNIIKMPTTIFWGNNDEFFDANFKLRVSEFFSCLHVYNIDATHNSIVKSQDKAFIKKVQSEFLQGIEQN